MPARRRRAGFRRAAEGEEFEQVVRRLDARDAEAPGRGGRMHQQRRGVAQPRRGGLGGQRLDLAVGGDEHGPPEARDEGRHVGQQESRGGSHDAG